MNPISIGTIIAEEKLPYVDESGAEHVFTMALGEPIEGAAGIWHCPYKWGSDGAETIERRASNGRLSAIINACNVLDARRFQVVHKAGFDAKGLPYPPRTLTF